MSTDLDQGLAPAELQAELRDLLALAVFGDHVRFVLRGEEREALADWLAEAVERWRGLAARVARRLAELGVVPDGRVRSLVDDIPLNWVPAGWLRPDDARRLVATRLSRLAEWASYRRLQATDPDTVRLLDAVCRGLELTP